ncbi:hypothetical protein CDD82_2496 [Ophiocordyceps australis]|uniref:Tat pathway signal sequence n=1 Tax=Ophiocordyceps australis TaxID=1399860 RepID=A0A2C5ZHS7_9HYPO|nr:hypothetical protein CDD82_2496 [Ophiocordyceps australis]
MPSQQKYSRLAWLQGIPKQESDGDDDSDAQLLAEQHAKVAASKRHWAPWLVHGIIFFIYTAALMGLLLVSSRRQSCVEKFNYYSPANAGISEDYVELTYNGSLWHQGLYKGPPTPQVNQAWEDLMAFGAIRVTAEDIQRVGHSLDAVQFPPQVGGGYLAVTIGTHHIHCLHYIWQDHHMDSFPDTAADKAGAPEMYERHYEHCVDFLRQGIMCNFDPGIIPYHWVRNHNQPTPDGSTRHKCVNWEYLQDWLKSRAVEMPEGFKWRQPPDAVSLDQNP